jgi:hypothetical protein
MTDYTEMMRNQYDFLQNHLNLLSSLQTSKSHSAKSLTPPTPDAGKSIDTPPYAKGISDDNQYTGEGIPGAGIESLT